ncbi:MAG: hypothetical protein HXY40_13365 [Chloroflexi bacterium]|nr:hypothetical protein [Chloroflexota bacterium]
MSDKVKVFEIKQYMIVWRQLEMLSIGGATIKLRAIVKCIGDEYSLDVYFVAPDSPLPAPAFLPAEKKGYMFMPISDIQAFVDTIRNEKPIFGHLRGDKPEWTSVTTSKEPVGEGSSDLG